MTGTSWNGNLLATVSVALAIVLTGSPSFSAEPVARDIRPVGVPDEIGADGNAYREGGNGTAVPCGTSVDGAILRSRSAEQSVAAAPEDRGPRPPRATGEEPRPADSPCSVETLRKRAAKARIS